LTDVVPAASVPEDEGPRHDHPEHEESQVAALVDTHEPARTDAVDESGRLSRALHWAQQGTTPEVSQGRWLRRLAGQSQQRLDERLNDEQIDDVAMVAALVHAEAMAEGAALARRHMIRSRVLGFVGTVVGAAIGAGVVHYVLLTTL